MNLYTTPPSILTLVTCLPQSRLAVGQTPHVDWQLGLQPAAITILQCVASLAAGSYDQPCGPIKIFFSIESGLLLDNKALWRKIHVVLQHCCNKCFILYVRTYEFGSTYKFLE